MDIVLGRIRLKPGMREAFWAFVPGYVAATRSIQDVSTCEITESREDAHHVILAFVYNTAEAHGALAVSPHEAAMLRLLNDVAIDGVFDKFTSEGRRTDRLTFPLGASA